MEYPFWIQTQILEKEDDEENKDSYGILHKAEDSC